MHSGLANKLPLNLMHLHYAQCLPHLQKPHPSQSLGEYISELVFSPDMIYLHLALLNALTNKMELSINVFASIMMHWILTQGNG